MALLFHVANYQDAPRWSCTANADFTLGEVIKIVTGPTAGLRYAQLVTVAADVQKPGIWGVSMKIVADPFQVNSSTVPARLGIRTVTIISGDAIVQVMAPAIIEYDVSLLHTTLDPTQGGVTPTVGQSLGVSTVSGHARWSTAAASDLVNIGTTLHIGRVYQTFGTKVLIQLVESPV